jgi:hypothetical protein
VRLPAAPEYVAEFTHGEDGLGPPQRWSSMTTGNSAVKDFDVP